MRIGVGLQLDWRHWCSVFVPSPSHTRQLMCVACSCSPSTWRTRVTSGTSGVDYTVPCGPVSCQCDPIRRRLALTVCLLHISPSGQLPHAVCTGLFSSSCEPTIPLIYLLANHLQRLGSSRCFISSRHSFPLSFQSTCVSIALSILCKTASFTDLQVD